MGRKLKARIIEVYGGQWRFAAALNLHASFVSKVICGKIQLDPARQQRWAAALDIEDPGILFPKESSHGETEA